MFLAFSFFVDAFACIIDLATYYKWFNSVFLFMAIKHFLALFLIKHLKRSSFDQMDYDLDLV